MSRRKLPDGFWEYLAIDFKFVSKNQQLCVVVDYFSRYIEVKVMLSTTTEKVTEFMTEIFARHGRPYSITSDNGSSVFFCRVPKVL